jgi:peptidoglycan hydrolase-like protein with peptidoglycan-binding domain
MKVRYQGMLLISLTFLSAISISSVAVWYSIIGLMAIFSASPMAIAIMGGTLEVGKLVAAVWLHQSWRLPDTKRWMKNYLTVAVVVLMLITSMGIFGFLSKAHIEHAAGGKEIGAKIERLTDLIARENYIIERANKKINDAQNQVVDTSTNTSERIAELQTQINNAYDRRQPEVNEQQEIINRSDRLVETQTKTYLDQLKIVDARIAQLEKHITDGEIEKVQALVGVNADGVLREITSQAIRDFRATNNTEKTRLLNIIEEIRNADRPEVRAARMEIKRLRTLAEQEIASATVAIEQIRATVTYTDTADIDELVDTQTALIKTAYTEIDTLSEEKFIYEKQYRIYEADVGPIKYIAEFVFTDDKAADKDMLEEAVRWVIVIIIFVFDPFAVMMLLAATSGMNRRHRRARNPLETPPEDAGKVAVDETGRVAVTSEKKKLADPDPIIVEKVVTVEVPVEVEVEKLVETEVEKIVEVEADVNLNTPEAIAKLEKRLQKKLKKKGSNDDK